MNHPGAHNQGRIVTMDMTPDIWFTVMLGTHTHTHTHTHAKKIPITHKRSVEVCI